MLEIKHLSKAYKKHEDVVKDVCFQIPDGRVGILLGPNGAGKSTIIKSIAGLLNFRGEVFVAGYPNRSMEGRSVLGYAPEIPSVYTDLTVEENVEFITRAYGRMYDAEEALHWFERFDLTEKRKEMAGSLSKGMTQKLNIICAFMIHPRVVLLDEPFIGLDPKAIRTLKDVIREQKTEGITFLISTHIIDTIRELWDDLIILKKGEIIGHFAVENTGSEDIEALFFEMTETEDTDGETENETRE